MTFHLVLVVLQSLVLELADASGEQALSHQSIVLHKPTGLLYPKSLVSSSGLVFYVQLIETLLSEYVPFAVSEAENEHPGANDHHC